MLFGCELRGGGGVVPRKRTTAQRAAPLPVPEENRGHQECRAEQQNRDVAGGERARDVTPAGNKSHEQRAHKKPAHVRLPGNIGAGQEADRQVDRDDHAIWVKLPPKRRSTTNIAAKMPKTAPDAPTVPV